MAARSTEKAPVPVTSTWTCIAPAGEALPAWSAVMAPAARRAWTPRDARGETEAKNLGFDIEATRGERAPSDGKRKMGDTGLEPVTSTVSLWRASQLRQSPEVREVYRRRSISPRNPGISPRNTGISRRSTGISRRSTGIRVRMPGLPVQNPCAYDRDANQDPSESWDPSES